jgi:phage terminase large subunit-like protein
VSVMEDWRTWDPPARLRLLERLEEERYHRLRAAWQPYPWQVPPGEVEALGMWLMLGGRGTGKTDGAARYVDDHMNGPPCDPRIPGGHRAAIIAPTLGDAAESCVLGPSGLRAHNPGVRLKSTQGGSKVVWPNGSEARLMGAYTPEDVERLRAGGNRCLVWMEEVAAMRYLADALEHTTYGLRIGPRPHFVGSTTPKPIPALRKLLADPTTITTRGRTQDAVHLDDRVRAKLYARYLGTRMGRQELEGELLDDIEGALWTWARLDRDRVTNHPPLVRAVVAIDPAVSNTEHSDETGIVVCGLDDKGHGYVLDDLSGRYSPEEWSRRALDAADRWDADLVAEKNNGGDLVASVLNAAGGSGRYRLVTATKGKRVRAEPVALLAEQGKVHHVGSLAALEEQLTSWTPEANVSPDRLDAFVWAMTDLMVRPRRGGTYTAT